MLLLPDLPDLLSTRQPPAPPVPPAGEAAEIFVECAPEPAGLLDRRPVSGRARRTDATGLRAWGRIASELLDVVPTILREAEVILAPPLPAADLGRPFDDFVREEWFSHAGADLRRAPFLQLVYPWVRSDLAARLPGGVMPADGLLAGIIAGSTLAGGAWRTVAGRALPRVSDVEPRPVPALLADGAAGEALTLVGRTIDGFRVLSDVTTSREAGKRPAPVRRLVAMILRAARNQGWSSVFEPSAERLWRDVELDLGGLLTAVFTAGGLRGATPDEAFTVRCGRSTMTQADIDAGRLIAQVEFAPAFPVDRIAVNLFLGEGAAARLAGAAA